MAYTLQAFIGRRASLESFAPKAASVCELDLEWALIPLTEEVRTALSLPSFPMLGGEPLPESLGGLGASLSTSGRVAYVEAELFGGGGEQACAVWERRKLLLEPTLEPNAVNKALKLLGVVVGNAHDEFDAIQLGRHRMIDDWT